MQKINFNVKLNKRETKYLTPEGKELSRVSEYKKILGDPWSKYSIGMYKGRDQSFEILQSKQDLILSFDDFKASFNKLVKDNKEKPMERGKLFHEEIEIAWNEEDIKIGLQQLINIPIIDNNGLESFVSNPFAVMFLDYMEKNPKKYLINFELSFTYEDKEIGFGGTIDTLWGENDEDGNLLYIDNVDMKTTKHSKEERIKYSETSCEYALQHSAYRKPILGHYNIPKENYRAFIFWEDGEITIFDYKILDEIEEQLILGIKYLEASKRNVQNIKTLLETE